MGEGAYLVSHRVTFDNIEFHETCLFSKWQFGSMNKYPISGQGLGSLIGGLRLFLGVYRLKVSVKYVRFIRIATF